MLLYKIDENISDVLDFSERLTTTKTDNQFEDFGYMINMVSNDYTNYFKASYYLQCRYDFSLQAIYSCLSKVNNDENKTSAYKELSKFLNEIKTRSGIFMQIIHEKETLYVRERPKIKTRRRKTF